MLVDQRQHKPQALIRNYDALDQLLLRVISSSVHTQVVQHSLGVVRELMANWKNIVIIKRMHVLDHLMVLAIRIYGLQEVISTRDEQDSKYTTWLDRLLQEHAHSVYLPLEDSEGKITSLFWEILQLTSLL